MEFLSIITFITFNAMDGGVDRGLLHPNNFVNEWKNIEWHGGTHIMDGWRKMLRAYENRFSDMPQSQWPLLLALIITDGELQDGPEFEYHLKHVKGRMFVEIAVVGFGDDHDRALEHYKSIAAEHDHVRVTSFTDHLDPSLIVKQLVSLIDANSVKQITSTQMLPSPNLNTDFNNNNNISNNNNTTNSSNNSYYTTSNVSYLNNTTSPNMMLNTNINPSLLVYNNNNNNSNQLYNNTVQTNLSSNNTNPTVSYDNNITSNTMNTNNQTTYWVSSNNPTAPPYNPY